MREYDAMRNFLIYSPRKLVPWHAIDLLVIFLVFIYLQVLVWVAVSIFFDPCIPQIVSETQGSESAEIARAHPLARMLMLGQEYPFVFWIAFSAGVIVIPIGEEFLFRLVLQGFMEKVERKTIGNSFPMKPHGAIAITVSSIIFASLHSRSTETVICDLNELVSGMFAYMVFYIIFIVSASIYLYMVRQATLDDLGIQTKKIPEDIATGFGAAVILLPPILLCTVILNTINPNFVWDPIPIFFLSIGLGYLYFKTHRIIPSIILHATLNGISFFTVYFDTIPKPS